MRGKNVKYALIVIMLLALGFGVGRLSAAGPMTAGGTLDSPGPPESIYSYTLEDIYNRLDTGAAGTPSPFTEPASGPTVGTGHTLSEIMAIAPAIDDINGATQADVLAGKTVWGLTSSQWGPIAGTYPLASVPKTGQTVSYGTRDDGDLEKGIAWPSLRFTDNGDGTVTDNLTGLIWPKNASCGGLRTWAGALTFANSLYDGWTGDGSGGDCGLSDGSSAGDWRLPNVRELQSLVYYGVYNPAVPNTAGTGKWSAGDPFTGVQSYCYWSSTTLAGDTSGAWRVHLGGGYLRNGDRSSLRYVWPVRGGQ
jgi:hypothetical protein